MCLIILKTYKGKILKSDLKNAFKNNPDGVGFAYTNYNNIIVNKRIYKKDEFEIFYTHYKEFETEAKKFHSNLLIHFRYATNGKISTDMCHPFKVYPGLVFAHNGIISGNEYENELLSDTYLYNEKVFKKLPKEFYLNEGIINLIKKDVGNYNKLIFLDKYNRYTIINEDQGQWFNGCWYSYPIRYIYNSKEDEELAQYYESLYSNGGF